MSYCHFSIDSDVYLIHNGREHVCIACLADNNGRPNVALPTPMDAINHLLYHRSKKQPVPQEALDRLWREVDPLRQAVHEVVEGVNDDRR